MRRGFFRVFTLLLFPFFLFSSPLILQNEGILPQKTIQKIEEIGKELYQKTKINLYLVAVNKMPTSTIVEFEKNITSTLTPPYALLTIAIKDHKVDIVSSKDVAPLFDKEEILSPLPWKGSIIPLLTSRSKDQKAAIEAALLNGYAEIAEQIASSKGVVLESGLGNTNKTIYFWLRVVFYSIILLIFLKLFYKKVVRR